MADLRQLLTGERPYPLWLRLSILVPGIVITVALFERRGIVVAAVGALVWGALFVSTWRGVQHSVRWSREHPVLDSLLVVPFAFVALAYLTRLGLGWCVLIGAGLWPVALVLGRRRRRVVHRGRAGVR
jgi:hypothetical protein